MQGTKLSLCAKFFLFSLLFAALGRAVWADSADQSLGAKSLSQEQTQAKLILMGQGFFNPLFMAVSLRQNLDAQGQIPESSQDMPVMAFLVSNGYLETAPNAAGAPWWNFRLPSVTAYVTGGGITYTLPTRPPWTALIPSVRGFNYDIPIAIRTHVSESLERSWSQGAVEYYAATFSYTLSLSDKIQHFTGSPKITGSVRLAIKNDPRVGTWQLDSITWAQNDVQVIRDLIAKWGRFEYGVLQQRIFDARMQAFSDVQKRIASQGILEKNPKDPRVIVSKNHALMFYRMPPWPVHWGYSGLRLPTLNNLKTMCRDVKSMHAIWQLPIQAQLGAMFWESQKGFNPGNLGGYNLIDTPDHRIWGSFGVAGGEAIIPTNTVEDGLDRVFFRYLNGPGFSESFGGTEDWSMRGPIGSVATSYINLICVAPIEQNGAPEHATLHPSPSQSKRRPNLLPVRPETQEQTKARPESAASVPRHHFERHAKMVHFICKNEKFTARIDVDYVGRTIVANLGERGKPLTATFQGQTISWRAREHLNYGGGGYAEQDMTLDSTTGVLIDHYHSSHGSSGTSIFECGRGQS